MLDSPKSKHLSFMENVKVILEVFHSNIHKQS